MNAVGARPSMLTITRVMTGTMSAFELTGENAMGWCRHWKKRIRTVIRIQFDPIRNAGQITLK